MKVIELLEDSKFNFTRIGGGHIDLDDDAVIKWCNEHASEYLSNPVPLYRGDGFGYDAIYHTKDFDRVSKNTLNYYTLWMDNHPDWAAYPKRSKSLICSTSLDTASGFHNKIFRVIPSNDCKIGVAHTRDLWYGFAHIRAFFRNSGLQKFKSNSMDNMVSALHSFFKLVGVVDETEYHEMGRSPLERDWPMMRETLKIITTDVLRDIISQGELKRPVQQQGLSVFIKKLERAGFSNLYEALDSLMDPKLNGFEVVNTDNIPKVNDSEVWVGGGDCLLIQTKSYRDDLFTKLGLI